MFLSDNGGCTEEPGGRDDTQQPGIVSTYTAVGPAWGWAQNTPFRRYKSWVNEGGISTPFIVRWPGHVKAGTMSGQVGHIIDVLPTCLELAERGSPTRSTVSERSRSRAGACSPFSSGETRTPPQALYWEWSGNCAVRQGQWKLVWDTAAKPVHWALYDIEADRTELHDRAAEMPEKVAELKADYTRWAKATGRAIPGVAKKKP